MTVNLAEQTPEWVATYFGDMSGLIACVAIVAVVGLALWTVRK